MEDKNLYTAKARILIEVRAEEKKWIAASQIPEIRS